jgi:hypothetical protein
MADPCSIRLKRALWAKQMANQIVSQAFQEIPAGGQELEDFLTSIVNEINTVMQVVRDSAEELTAEAEAVAETMSATRAGPIKVIPEN